MLIGIVSERLEYALLHHSCILEIPSKVDTKRQDILSASTVTLPIHKYLLSTSYGPGFVLECTG